MLKHFQTEQLLIRTISRGELIG